MLKITMVLVVLAPHIIWYLIAYRKATRVLREAEPKWRSLASADPLNPAVYASKGPFPRRCWTAFRRDERMIKMTLVYGPYPSRQFNLSMVGPFIVVEVERKANMPDGERLLVWSDRRKSILMYHITQRIFATLHMRTAAVSGSLPRKGILIAEDVRASDQVELDDDLVARFAAGELTAIEGVVSQLERYDENTDVAAAVARAVEAAQALDDLALAVAE